MNDDIYLGLLTPNIDGILEKFPNHKLYTNPVDWSVFILPKKTYELVGEFDEQFYPAYCEDNDFVYRLKLKGFKAMKLPFLLPKIHRTSMTLDKDYSLQNAFLENKEKYIAKWGGAPDFEVYKKPYNKK